MCLGVPLTHPCSHSSISWCYCPTASNGRQPGEGYCCDHITWQRGFNTDELCPLKNCDWHNKSGPWQCCACHQGPNYSGWCTMLVDRSADDGKKKKRSKFVRTTCDHGCCESCTATEFGIWDQESLSNRAYSTLGCGISWDRRYDSSLVESFRHLSGPSVLDASPMSQTQPGSSYVVEGPGPVEGSAAEFSANLKGTGKYHSTKAKETSGKKSQ